MSIHPLKTGEARCAPRLLVSGYLGLVVSLLVACSAAPLAAQVLPAEPITIGGGIVTIGGQLSLGYGSSDPGYYNYSSYAYDLLRLARVDGSAELHLGQHVSLLGDARFQADLDEGGTQLAPFAAFLRVRPSTTHNIDLQFGLVPPVFGALSRRGYGNDNPLIGMPLAYQYLNVLRPDAIPASADDLLRMRARGWRVRYPIGDQDAYHGVPLTDGVRNQLGAEVHVATGRVDVAAALTNGSQSDPEVRSGSVRLNYSGRVAVRLASAFTVGASASYGRFLDEAVLDEAAALGADRSGDQSAFAVDAAYEYGYWIVRGELLVSRWQMPRVAAPYIDSPLDSVGAYAEARYRVRPGLTAAVRVGRVTFDEITGTSGPATWDAPVTRVEAGAGYAIVRNVVVKATYQYNWRDSARYPQLGLVSAQLLVWF